MQFAECDWRECPARSTSNFVKGSLSLAFCGHHTWQVWQSLENSGWERISTPEETPGGSE